MVGVPASEYEGTFYRGFHTCDPSVPSFLAPILTYLENHCTLPSLPSKDMASTQFFTWEPTPTQQTVCTCP